jgi:lipoprotein NlpI
MVDAFGARSDTMAAFRGMAIAVLSTLLTASAAQATGIDDANSGVMAARDGRYEEAIELFTRAINGDDLNLKGRAQAFAYRGIAKATIGDYEGAQDDLNFAVVLDSDYNADAYAFRGYFRMVMGMPKEGAADLAKSAELLIWPYNVLWLYLARLKGGVPDTGNHSIAANAMILDEAKAPDGSTGLTRWPGAVVKFMMGKMKAEEVRAAANQGDPARLSERVCDADFYLAEVELAHGNAASARPMLQAAVDRCPFGSFERMGATAELSRVK